VPQTRFECLPLDHLQIHFRFKKLEIVAPFCLGLVHGRVRVLDQRFGVFSVPGEHADPDATVDMEFLAADEMGRAERKQ